VLGSALVALVLVVYYDLQTGVSFGDEWIYRWTTTYLVSGHGLHLWPGVGPPALVQVAAASLLQLAHPAPMLLRLTQLPFVPLQGYFAWRIARDLGADRTWAAIGSALLVSTPLALAVDTGLMSEPSYLALMLGSAWCGIRWMRTGRSAAWCVALGALAALERQHGFGLALAIPVGLLMARERRLTRRDVVGIVSLWVAAGLAIAFPYAAGFASSAMRPEHTQAEMIGSFAGTVVLVPVMLGLFLLPLLVGLLRRSPDEAVHRGRLEVIPVILAVAGIAAAATWTFHFGVMIYPGDYFSNGGLGQHFIQGLKPALIPLPIFFPLEALTATTTVVLLFWRRRLWHPAVLGAEATMLVALALTQVLPMLVTGAVDRYHLAVAAPLIPVLVAVISRSNPRGAATVWAAVFIITGVIFYAAAEQDYEAWRVAIHDAAVMAYRLDTPDHVDAGFDEMGDSWVVPTLDRTGRPPAGLKDFRLKLQTEHYQLRFAERGDPAEGVDYQSLAPGRIIVVRSRPAR
jgi:hypothetical protein